MPASAASRFAPTLIDGDVIIRAHLEGDTCGVFEQCQDPLSQRWTRVPVPYSMQDAAEFVTSVVPAGWASDSEWAFAVESGGRFVGTISLRNEGEGRAEIAYGAHPWARGTGAMERALRLLIDWGFASQDLQTIVWWANVGNWASHKVAWRLGFSFDGTVRHWQPQRGVLHDGWVGTLLRDDPREPGAPWLTAPVLEGAGFRLRSFRPEDDLDRIVEGSADERTQFWLAGLPRLYTRADAALYVARVSEGHATNTSVTWAIADADDDRLIGTMGLFRLVPGREVEVGYWTHPEGRGRGVTAAAAGLAVQHAFEVLGVLRVTAYVSATNTASRRIIETLGLRQTGVERQAARTGDGAVADLVGYDVLAEEWRNSRR